MACFHPLEAWYACDGEDKGKVFFSRLPGRLYIEAKLPCGKCDGCRLEYARQWAIRCMHEAEMHEDNCMITLTYSEENKPDDGSLRPEDVTLFLKRFRKYYKKKKIKYFLAGEYGDKFNRPHYHILLFGIDFKTESCYNKGDDKDTDCITTVEKIWGKGYVKVTPLTYQSAAYVARYCLKKQAKEIEYVDKSTGVIREREYVRMSRRPGIGSTWIDRYSGDTYKDDKVVYGKGQLSRPPRYYDKRYKKQRGEDALDVIKQNRLRSAAKYKENNTPEKLIVKEKIAKARMLQKKRGYENG